MKRFVWALAAAVAFAAPAMADVPTGFAVGLFQPLTAQLAKSGVPVLLPGGLSAGDLQGVLAELQFADARGYGIELDYARGCNGATACHLGTISGAHSDGAKLRGTAVTLPDGTRAFYVQGPCGASCSDSTLTFDRNGYRYAFAAKGAARDYLVRWASVLLTAKQLQS